MASSLFVISGNFSGAGKTCVLEGARERFPQSKKVITCTTRAPRPGEVDNVHYRFFTREEFAEWLLLGAFAEHEYHEKVGNYYGTLRQDIESAEAGDVPAFLVTELKGVRTLQRLYPDAHYVFVQASVEEIRNRLSVRGDSKEDIEKRIRTVIDERKLLKEVRIDRFITNRDGELDRAIDEFCAFVAERMTNIRVVHQETKNS